MQTRPWPVFGLAALVLPALWLLLAGPDRLLGLDSGHVGMVLLVTATWTSLLALSQLPRGEAEVRHRTGEWKAWIGTGFMLVAMLYSLGKADVFAGASFGDRDAQAVARILLLLLIAWAVLSPVVASRWKGAVEEDERDREIVTRAAAWGRGALIACVVAIALIIGFSPPDRLQWATHLMVANILVFALMAGWLAECAAAAILCGRDRIASAA